MEDIVNGNVTIHQFRNRYITFNLDFHNNMCTELSKYPDNINCRLCLYWVMIILGYDINCKTIDIPTNSEQKAAFLSLHLFLQIKTHYRYNYAVYQWTQTDIQNCLTAMEMGDPLAPFLLAHYGSYDKGKKIEYYRLAAARGEVLAILELIKIIEDENEILSLYISLYRSGYTFSGVDVPNFVSIVLKHLIIKDKIIQNQQKIIKTQKRKLKYAPGGPGYEEAKEHFSSYQS